MSATFAGDDPNRAPVSALIDELSSQGVEVRRAAAERIIEAGYFAIERVARYAAPLDAESWKTFADAVMEDEKREAYACALVAAAHAAPEAHRRRLINLARRLNPEAARTPTPREIEALVRRELVEKPALWDDYSFVHAVAIHGHAGMPATLNLLRDSGLGAADLDRASSVVSAIAQPEDIPALRELLLEGKSRVAAALSRLDALGFTKALDALVEAVRAGRFDDRISAAVCDASNRGRAARAVREWMHRRGRSLTEQDRLRIALVFACLESRTDIPILEEWVSSFRDPANLLALGRALTNLGSAKGIDLLVRIVGEKKVDPPPRQMPEDTGRLSAGGFGEYERWVALRALNAVVVQLSDHAQRPWGDSYGDLDQVAPGVRAWWEKARDRIQFDEKAGEWRLKAY